MKLATYVSFLLLLYGVYGQYRPDKGTRGPNQAGTGIHDGHRLITRALWRIFDALMEKKSHEELYGRVKVVENALTNMKGSDSSIDSQFKSIKSSLDGFKNEISSMRRELDDLRNLESRIESMEEWQLRYGGQMDQGEVVSALGVIPQAAFSSCSSPFEPVGGECIHPVVTEKLSWRDARRECARLGGDLASPRDLVHFRSYLRNLPSDLRPTYAWIGGSRTADDIWVWATGSQPGRPMDMSQDTWNVDLPRGIGDCAGLFELAGYRAYDYKCEEEDNFICQYFL